MSSTGEHWRLGHRRALDGLRGVAILLVLACHVSIPGMTGAGSVGVAAFFTLSGFLITGLLLSELEERGHVDLRAFYVRRSRRLFPALAASVLVTGVVAAVWLPWFFDLRDLLPVVLYVGNWVEASPNEDLGALGITWSLAVEEQFYLLWPLLVIGASRWGRRAVLCTAAAGAAASLVWRVLLIGAGAPTDRIYYGSDTIAFALLLGAVLVAWMLGRPERRAQPWMAVTGLALLAVMCSAAPLTAAYLALPVTAVATVLIMAGVSGSGGFAPLEHPVLIWFGQRSYGLYLWHGPLAWVLRVHLELPWMVQLAIVVPVSLLVAEASYRWIEQPFRRPSARRSELVSLGPVSVGPQAAHARVNRAQGAPAPH